VPATSPSDPLVAIRGLTVDFPAGPRAARALRGVDLSIGRGEALGLVGESGSGKSVTWLAALGLLPGQARVGGSVRLDGVELLGAPAPALEAVRGRRIAMIFQDPSASLNPVKRIGTQLAEALFLHRGLSRDAAWAEAARALDRVGIADGRRRLDLYPHEMSGGMNQRVMIAIALAGQPDLLVADEPTTALDATIQAQILDLLARLRGETGMAMVLVSHDLGVVAEACARIAVMYAGRIVEEAPSQALFDAPAHPYTRGLLAALPDLDGPKRRLAAIPGTVPEPWNLPPGCAFAPRCLIAAEPCATPPPFIVVGPSHRAACPRTAVLGALAA
jgi:peptide/nickel transport system ATP-binding protein